MPYKDKQKRLEHNRKYHKTWYNKNRIKRIKQIQLRKKGSRKWFYEYKSTLKCSICPENDPRCLDFHHRDPKSKKYEIAGMVLRGLSKLKIMEEIEKCDVLCSNCHRKLTINIVQYVKN